MRMRGALAALVATAMMGTSEARQSTITFHHLHIVDADGPRTVDFYARLFEPSVVTRFPWGADDVLQTGRVRLVISRRRAGGSVSAPQVPNPVDARATARRSAIWHYGWGEVSLGQSYLDHNLREVEWEPPLPPETFHLHVESVSPNAAALWYRDQLGAHIELAPPFTEDAPQRDLRRARAIAWIEPVALVFYRADDPLESTRGRREDHIAVQIDDVESVLARLVAADTTVLEPVRLHDGIRTAMIEGPDRVAIELVER